MEDRTMIETVDTVSGLVLRHVGDGHLVAVIGGGPVTIGLRQCFPWWEPCRHLSLRDGDDDEVAHVDDPAELEPVSRAALERALAEAGFVLRVTCVRAIDEEVEIRHWVVETAQGPRTF